MIAAYTKLLSEMEAIRLESNQYTLIVGKGIMQKLMDAHLEVISENPHYHLTHAPNAIKVILSLKVHDEYYKLFKDSDLHVDAAYKISDLKMLDVEYCKVKI